jgi:hypothetical protein
LSVADPRQYRFEGDTWQLQRAAFEVDHVAVLRSLQRQRDHVASEQRLEAGVGVVPQGRNLDVDFLAFADVVSDKAKPELPPRSLPAVAYTTPLPVP